MMEVCAVCGKPATSNWQRAWVKYPYNAETDEYGEMDLEAMEFDAYPLEGENLFFCDDHVNGDDLAEEV